MGKKSGIDWGSFRERSDDPEIRNLYHSSPTNFPYPQDVFPELKEAYDHDAMVALDKQLRAIAAIGLLPFGGSGFLGNAAVSAASAGLLSDAETLPDMAKDMAVGGAVGGSLAVAAPVVAREVSSNVRHLFGKTPKITIPMGPRGSNRVLSEIGPQRYRQSLLATRGSKIDPRAPVLHDAWRNRMNIPGEASRFSSIEVPLSARGRAMLNADASYLDRVYAAIRKSSSLESSRFGTKIDAVFKNSPEKATLSTAYPRWLQTTRITKSKNLPSSTTGSSTRFRYLSESAARSHRDTEHLIELNKASKVDMRATAGHEIKHSLETREPFSDSLSNRGLSPVAVDAARRRAALIPQEVGVKEFGDRYGSMLDDELYKSQIQENTARLYGLLNRYGVRNMNALEKAAQAKRRSGALSVESWGTDEIGRPFIQHPDSQAHPVYPRAKDLQDNLRESPVLPETQLADKGGQTARSPAKSASAKRYYGKQPMYTGKGRDKAYYERRSRVLDRIVPFIYEKEKQFNKPSPDTNGNLRLAFSTQYLYDPTDSRSDRSGFRKVTEDDYTDLKGSKRASTSRLRWLYDKMLEDAPQLEMLDDARLARLVDRHYNGTPEMFSKDVSKILHATEKTRKALIAWADGEHGISSYGATVRGVTDPVKRQQIEEALRARIAEAKAYVEANESYDTPIPKNLRSAYETWRSQLPEELRSTHDYDLQGAWLENLGRPTTYTGLPGDHLPDFGKKPNHPTFSSGSKWHDPDMPERTGGTWKQAEDKSWDFYPGSGNRLSDDELKDYFDKFEKGNRVHERDVRQDAKGGEVVGTEVEEPTTQPAESRSAAPTSGPRIVINPSTFKNKKDALCVAFNEAFRILMEVTGFEPQAEPTPAQRRFFADTAYADDELMLRRTILARICTFDTSIS